jgi:hypothetical protein
MIDFSPIERGESNLLMLADGVTVADLRAWTHESIETLLAIIGQANDEMTCFVPYDPDADDPFAEPEMRYVGWTLGHLVAHVTATSEETAATSAILARGIAYPADPRLRYETPWQDISTQEKARQRLKESLRMRLGALDMFPDAPHLNTFRQLSSAGLARYGLLNAPAQFLMGLRHEVGHYAQFREVLRQAMVAVSAGAGGA